MLERYEAYKDSGVEWIGEVPASWRLVKNKYKFAIRKRIAGFDGPDVLSITQQGIRKKDIKSGEGQLAASYANYQWVFPGDFAMNHMDLLTGWVDCSSFKGVTSPDYRVFCPIAEDIDRRFYKCLFQHCYTGKVFYGLGQGVSNFGRWRMSADQFNNFVIPVPPLEEQRAIADFLDEKTTEIDSIISETERSIELLHEYRKSVISEAVTKGLDPNVPMKDSGVEWIGEIPAVWDVARMSNFVRFHSGDSLDSTLLKSESPYPVYGGGNVKGRYDQSNISAGSVLVSRQGATCGAARYIASAAWATEHALIATKLCTMDSRWLAYFLGNMNLGQYSMTAAQPGISADKIESLPIVVASTWEQERIADYLDAKTSEIDALIADKERQVELLKEYRKSLISEAVTGKFKVPGVS